MRRRGVALSRKEIGKDRGVKGDVRVTCVQDQDLGRATNIAELCGGPGMQSVTLPVLRDVRLSGMATSEFVLSGFEQVDGCAYAQSWWCRLP